MAVSSSISSPEGTWDTCERYAKAALPLCLLHRPFHGPLSLILATFKSTTHFPQGVKQLQQGHYKEALFDLLQVALATSAIALFLFNPFYCFLFSSVSDLLLSSRTVVESFQKGSLFQEIEAIAFAALDLLFFAALFCSAAELLLACMVVEITLDFYSAAKYLQEGRRFEGGCKALLGAGFLYQTVGSRLR